MVGRRPGSDEGGTEARYPPQAPTSATEVMVVDGSGYTGRSVTSSRVIVARTAALVG